jgi:hypothetical protein
MNTQSQLKEEIIEDSNAKNQERKSSASQINIVVHGYPPNNDDDSTSSDRFSESKAPNDKLVSNKMFANTNNNDGDDETDSNYNPNKNKGMSHSSSTHSNNKVKFIEDNEHERESLLPDNNDNRNSNEQKASIDDNESKYFMNEHGKLKMNKSDSKQTNISRASNTESITSKSSKCKKALQFKYDRESKDLQIHINIGNNETDHGCLSQLKTTMFYQALIAEIIGTFILTVYICSFGLPIDDPTHQNSPASINSAIGSGLIVKTSGVKYLN